MRSVVWSILSILYLLIQRSTTTELPVLSEDAGTGNESTQGIKAAFVATTEVTTINEINQFAATTQPTTDIVTTAEATIVTQTETILPKPASPRCPWECNADRCGTPPPSVKKIVGGMTAKPFSWPWMGSVWANDTLLCGATLICQSWVITAAHCFLDSTGRRLDLGRTRDLYLGRYHKRGSYKAVKRIRLEHHLIHVHIEYDISRSYNDIALIRLPKPIKFTRRIFPACLPKIGSQSPTIGVNCKVAGWGETMGIGPRNKKLKEATVPLVSTDTCKYAYYFSKTEQILCAGGGNQDPCAGDSGGPLLCKSSTIPGKWEIQGIITYGASNCGTADLPGIYAKVTHYLKWIHRVMENECAMWRFLFR